MIETYRKWGRVVRRENATTIHVEETGEATETDDVFRAVPGGMPKALPKVDADAVAAVAHQIETSIASPLVIERLIVSEGVALHAFGETEWRERSRRIHLSIARPPLRALLDLGDFDVESIRAVAAALARVEGERVAPTRMRLVPSVAAALLTTENREVRTAIVIEQTGGGIDGKGQSIETRRATGGKPPNWYRPSYTTRPVRAWLNVRAVPFGAIDEDLPRAIALLAPIDGRTMRLLCVENERVYPATFAVSRITAVANDATWYPYAAGAFGAEMMV